MKLVTRFLDKGYEGPDRRLCFLVALALLVFMSIPLTQYFAKLYTILEFISLLFINGILLYFLFFAKVMNAHFKFFFLKPLLFILLLLGFIKFFLRFQVLPEKVIVLLLITLIVGSLIYFVLKSSYIILYLLIEKRKSAMMIPFLFIVTFSFLGISDLIFSMFAYDLVLNLHEVKYSFLARLYFSFSLHFSLPMSLDGKCIQSYLLKDSIGQFTMSAHLFLNHVMNVTIIGFIGSLFVKLFNNKTRKPA